MPRDKLHDKPIFVLEDRWQEKLSKLPEHGQAYQYVDVILKNGAIFEGLIVLSCVFIQGTVPFEDAEIKEIVLSRRFPSRVRPSPKPLM